MRCDLNELRNYIKNENLGKVNLCIESLARKWEYIKYHFGEYERMTNHIKNSNNAIIFIFDSDKNKIIDKLGIEANIIALMQNLHTIQDILGHLIYYSLDLKIQKEEDISLGKVKNKLKELTNLENLINLIDELNTHPNSNFLNAVVNMSKHRYIIFPLFYVEMSKNWYGYKFLPFEYKGKKHEEKRIHEFILEEYKRELKLEIKIKNELINYLKTYK
ncbi:hypothetical protein [Aliarcobacter butzleri]|uniref:hypothetical protein n=1 Tax=Aliarcobacter butzleri TaxID=28197 RepID=UPI00125FB9EC|nr:hypothetical protein [Aliarcobacter butzleri]MCG3677892.1 hypothetical protein [Aliarcobacter butzleri]